jgi:hypothetical protein
MSDLQNALQPGYTQFYDNDEPGLLAGTYEISVTQALPNAVTDQFAQTVTQRFIAQAPQFTLDSAEVHAMFPQPNTNGDFSAILPNILLENPKLPWERALTSDTSIPWMALLVFKANEIQVDPATNSPVITSSVQDFLAPVEGVVKPAIDSSNLSPTLLNSSMNSIRIRTEVFQAVTPRLVELASLAHVREVNPEHQPVGDAGIDPWYSVAMSNRFPDSANPDDDAGAVNFVHLVSFEGLTPYLVDAPQWPAGAAEVQLVSLVAWRFVSTLQAGQSFGDLASYLIASVNGDTSQLLLKIPAAANGTAAAQRVALGYTALSYHTLPGPETFTWYRGPFSAVPPQPLPPGIETYLHPSQAEIYDQANGIFDQSYAAAWTIGRLTALADPEFIDSIQQVRGQVLRNGRRLLERSKMPHLAGMSMAELIAPGATRKSFGSALARGMGGALTLALEQPPVSRLAVAAGPPHSRRKTSFLLPEIELPENPATELQYFLRQPRIGSFLTEQVSDQLDPLANWLAKLVLLYNIPFNQLAPDQRMLPVESIRFFYVDQGWLTVLAQAAMTVGVHGSRDQQVNSMVAPQLWRQAQRKVAGIRPRLLGRQVADDPPLPVMPAAGMLLRSELVSGWPGLAVVGTAAGTVVNALRIDRLAPNVLLVLWESVPDAVTVSQPQQGLAFGVEEGVIALRSLNTANLGQQLGSNFPASGVIAQFFRPPVGLIGERVLQLVPATAGTPNYLIPGLQQALAQPQLLSPAQFAIEMVNAPEQIQFNPLNA